MIPSFFHVKQPWKRHVAHAGFWALIVLGLLIFTQTLKIPAYAGHEGFLTFLVAMSIVGLMSPWFVFRYVPGFRGKGELELVGKFEMAIIACLVLSWIGSMWLYRIGWGYDTLVHVATSAALAYIFVLATARVRPSLVESPAKLIVLVCALTLGAGVINELFEWGGDRLLGTSMYGEAGEPNDTEVDFIGNTIGFLIGAMVGYLSIGEKRV